LMAALIEFPVLRVRDHLFPSRGRPLTVSAAQRDEENKNLRWRAAERDANTVEGAPAVQLKYVPATSPGNLDVSPRDTKSDG
jgi:hypothetical protein